MPPKTKPIENHRASQFLKEKPPDFLKRTIFSKVVVKKPCTFPLRDKEKGLKSCRTKSYPCDVSAEKIIENNVNMDDSNDSDVLSTGCVPASSGGVETVEKLQDQEIVSEVESQTIYEENGNGSGDVNKKSQIIRTNQIRAAKVDLSNIMQSTNLPNKPVLKQILITCSDHKFGVLSKLNPFHLAKEINEICGEVDNIEHRRSGSLLITTKTAQQADQLMKVKYLTNKQIPVTAVPDWSNQTVQGKVFVPQFAEDSLEELLEMLKPQGVIGIRKMFHDPKRAESSLYVLTFLGNLCPNKIKVGYTSAQVDKYYPSPLRCGNCCRWGHSTLNCHSVLVCSNCGDKGHIRNVCKATSSKCVNCRGQHDATSKQCPKYLNEKEICRVKIDQQISFKDARLQVTSGTWQTVETSQIGQLNRNSSGKKSMDSRKGKSSFPSLTQLMNQSPFTENRYSYLSHSQLEEEEAEEDVVSEPTYASITATQKQISPTNSQWSITPGQRNQKKYQKGKRITNEDDILWSDLEGEEALEANSVVKDQKNDKSKRSREREVWTYLQKFLEPLLPFVMRLLLSQSITDKVECFVEMGKLLKLDAIVDSMLQSLNMSSISNSQ